MPLHESDVDMEIVLDTNIIARHRLLRSRTFEMLLDFVAKTRSRVILPQIVYQELGAVYKREVGKWVREFRKASDDGNNLFYANLARERLSQLE